LENVDQDKRSVKKPSENKGTLSKENTTCMFCGKWFLNQNLGKTKFKLQKMGIYIALHMIRKQNKAMPMT
jgi:hypothetical protein